MHFATVERNIITIALAAEQQEIKYSCVYGYSFFFHMHQELHNGHNNIAKLDECYLQGCIYSYIQRFYNCGRYKITLVSSRAGNIIKSNNAHTLYIY